MTGSSIKWTMVKNKTYWNAESVHLTKLNYQVIKTTSTGLNLYKAGDLDYAPVDSDYVKQYQKNKDYHSKTTPTNGYMVFNLKRKTTGNVHVRRAISLGINREQLVKTALHSGKAAKTTKAKKVQVGTGSAYQTTVSFTEKELTGKKGYFEVTAKTKNFFLEVLAFLLYKSLIVAPSQSSIPPWTLTRSV